MNFRLARLLIIAIFGCIIHLGAAEKKGLGLKPITQEHIQHIEQNSHWVVNVKPNKLGAARIHEHLRKQGKPPVELDIAHRHHEEVSTHFGLAGALEKMNDQEIIPHLPSSVDNSKLPSFPPIGDQQQMGSCVAWGSTYYQTTHEYGLLNGINNKNGTQHVLSPKWTYNLLNGGGDNGLNPADAFALLAQNGATTLTNLPYDGVDYLSWDSNPQDWVSAISYRMNPVQMITGIGGQTQNLQTIKQLLNNGHILTFATFVESWVCTKVKKDPSNANSPAVGQQAVSWMSGAEGGHYMTIVGYNDNIWIDINGNGKVDAGEKGAFLIANSWSAGWGNQGFIWVAYDAFLSKSAVQGGPHWFREPLAAAMNNYVASITPKAANYTPSLVAQFTLSQSNRSAISIGGGASGTGQSSPAQNFRSKALVNEGGDYEFNGTHPSSAESGTFALDLTDLLPAQNNSSGPYRYYLELGDNNPSYPTTLTAFNLLDVTHNHQEEFAQVPLRCNDQTVNPYLDYDYYAVFGHEADAPAVSITSHLDGTTVDGVAHVGVNAASTAGISKVEFYVDSVLHSTEEHPPYLAFIDTKKLSEGPHEIKAIGYDAENNAGQSTITVTVNNSAPKVAVNAGGAGDHSFSSPSNVLATTGGFDNPVYQTERNGHFTYEFGLDNGPHTVTLKFAELRFSAPGKRVFNVAINGQQVITNLDLVKVAGYRVPYDLSFPVNVTNNQIQIEFIPVVNKAKVNGIEITAN